MFFTDSMCAIWMQTQFAAAHLGVRLICRFNLRRSRRGRALPFAHSGKRKQKRILLAKTKSSNQRKVSFLPHIRQRQLESFALPPSLCKHFTVVEFFFLAVGLFQQAFTNSRRQLEGRFLSPSKCKRFAVFYVFSFADVGGCQGVSFVVFFGFLLFCFTLIFPTSPQAAMVVCH